LRLKLSFYPSGIALELPVVLVYSHFYESHHGHHIYIYILFQKDLSFMIKVKYTVSTLLSVILLLGSFYCRAQVVDISACRTITDSLERFACYEKLTGTTTDAQPVAAPVSAANPPQLQPPIAQVEDTQENVSVSPAPTAIAPPEDSAQPAIEQSEDVNLFGRISATVKARLVEGSEGKDELIDTVAALKQIGPQLLQVTLQNGQQWQQMQNKVYRLRVGDEVRIYPTRWGSSYRLSGTRLASYIQVQRVD